MKKYCFLLILGCLFFTGCTSRSFSVENYYVSSWVPGEEFTWFIGCLSTNGNSINLSNLEQINLSSGIVTDLMDSSFQETSFDPDFQYYTNFPCGWSYDGGLLALTNTSEQVNGREHLINTFLVNFSNQSIIQLPDEIGVFEAWSPFSDDVLLASNSYGTNAQVYELNTFNRITRDTEIDFRSVEALGAYGITLWSQELNYPIGHLASTISNPYGFNFYPNLSVVSGINTSPESSPQYSLEISETPVIDAIFDPTGEYILISEWICGSENQAQSCNWDSTTSSDIIDTNITIVNWRTGERQLLFQLSQIGDGHYLEYGQGGLYWSADGSTIVISRIDASPVVLSVRYP